MRTVIYYFSGTGNSLAVARDLAKQLNDSEVELINLATITIHEFKILSADRIGIVFPVYMWHMPHMVATFINKLLIDKSKYVFAIATYDGIAGNVINQVKKQFRLRRIKLAAGFLIKMPTNYIPLFNPMPVEEQQKIFADKDQKILILASYIKRNQRGRFENSSIFTNLFFSGFLGKLGYKRIPAMDRYFILNDKCNGCEVCYRICPAKNILMKNNCPQWTHKCEQCLACLQWCPEGAIEFMKLTRNRKKYHHPDIKYGDLVIR
ncbi:MAG: EFR1 family ferrodoxin [Candidatus Omnitrophica bacterium]|nr:EFR1 family ferrodoxin [Candidatus Omnitrophota bacterium]